MSQEQEENKEAGASTTQNAVVTAAIAVYNETEAGLAELKQRLTGKQYPEIQTTAGYKLACADRTELTKVRTGTEKLRKEAKAPYLEAGKKIDEIAKRITAEAQALENPIQALIDAEDQRKAAIKAEKERIEAERIAGIRQKISAFTQFVIMAAGFDSIALTEHIAKIEAGHLVAADYAELIGEAEAARADVLVKLKEQLVAVTEKEAEEKRLEEERIENERKLALQSRVDAIRRVPVDAASIQSVEELETLKASVGSTDLTGMQEYEESATEAVTKAVADISAMIETKKAAKKLADDQAAFARQQEEAAEEQRLKDEAAEKERNRVATIKGMIAQIKAWPLKRIGLSSFYVRSEIEGSEMDIPCTEDDFQEFTAEAEAERLVALSTMTAMAEAAEKSEAEATRLENQRLEQESAQKVIDDAKREAEEREAAEEAERQADIIRQAEAAATPTPVAAASEPWTAEGIIAKIEGYGFECEAGALTNCVDWQTLKTIVSELRADSNLLNALRAAGVDNWDGWDDAVEAVEEAA